MLILLKREKDPLVESFYARLLTKKPPGVKLLRMKMTNLDQRPLAKLVHQISCMVYIYKRPKADLTKEQQRNLKKGDLLFRAWGIEDVPKYYLAIYHEPPRYPGYTSMPWFFQKEKRKFMAVGQSTPNIFDDLWSTFQKAAEKYHKERREALIL